MDLPDMCSLAPSIARILGIRRPRNARAPVIGEVVDDLCDSDRLAVIVIDALGEATWETARNQTPFINVLSSIHRTRMRSVKPSITPVNFATMLTGATPEEHGIRDRRQPLKLETLFDVLRERGGRSATAARAYSSLGILISPHADKPGIAPSNEDDEVRDLVIDHLWDGHDLVLTQLLDVDDAGHSHGPWSEESIRACSRADVNLRKISKTALKSGYAVVVLADHGQHPYVREDGSTGGTHGTDMDEDIIVPLVWASNRELEAAFSL